MRRNICTATDKMAIFFLFQAQLFVSGVVIEIGS